MTKLSPAAQAVYESAIEQSTFPNDAEWVTIYALRAAANALLNYKYWHDGFWDKEPAKFYRRKLLAIAAELEEGAP